MYDCIVTYSRCDKTTQRHELLPAHAFCNSCGISVIHDMAIVEISVLALCPSSRLAFHEWVVLVGFYLEAVLFMQKSLCFGSRWYCFN